jgi:hypothetical protein
MEYMTAKGGVMDGDEFFCGEINAKVVKDAEEYYRKAFSGALLVLMIPHIRGSLRLTYS